MTPTSNTHHSKQISRWSQHVEEGDMNATSYQPSTSSRTPRDFYWRTEDTSERTDPNENKYSVARMESTRSRTKTRTRRMSMSNHSNAPNHAYDQITLQPTPPPSPFQNSNPVSETAWNSNEEEFSSMDHMAMWSYLGR